MLQSFLKLDTLTIYICNTNKVLHCLAYGPPDDGSGIYGVETSSSTNYHDFIFPEDILVPCLLYCDVLMYFPALRHIHEISFETLLKYPIFTVERF